MANLHNGSHGTYKRGKSTGNRQAQASCHRNRSRSLVVILDVTQKVPDFVIHGRHLRVRKHKERHWGRPYCVYCVMETTVRESIDDKDGQFHLMPGRQTPPVADDDGELDLGVGGDGAVSLDDAVRQG